MKIRVNLIAEEFKTCSADEGKELKKEGLCTDFDSWKDFLDNSDERLKGLHEILKQEANKFIDEEK